MDLPSICHEYSPRRICCFKGGGVTSSSTMFRACTAPHPSSPSYTSAISFKAAVELIRGTNKPVEARFWPWLEPVLVLSSLNAVTVFPPRSTVELCHGVVVSPLHAITVHFSVRRVELVAFRGTHAALLRRAEIASGLIFPRNPQNHREANALV